MPKSIGGADFVGNVLSAGGYSDVASRGEGRSPRTRARHRVDQYIRWANIEFGCVVFHSIVDTESGCAEELRSEDPYSRDMTVVPSESFLRRWAEWFPRLSIGAEHWCGTTATNSRELSVRNDMLMFPVVRPLSLSNSASHRCFKPFVLCLPSVVDTSTNLIAYKNSDMY